MYRGHGTFPPGLGSSSLPTDPNEVTSEHTIWRVLADPDKPASWEDHEFMKRKIEQDQRRYPECQYQEQWDHQSLEPQDNAQAWSQQTPRENRHPPLIRNALLDYQQQLDYLEARDTSATPRTWSSAQRSWVDCPCAACRQRVRPYSRVTCYSLQQYETNVQQYQFGLQLLEAQGRARWEKAKQERNDTEIGEECRQKPQYPPAQASDPAPAANQFSEIPPESARAKPVAFETAQLPPTSDIPNNEPKPAEMPTGSSTPLEMGSGEKLEEWELVRPYERNGPLTETVTAKNDVVPASDKGAASYLDTCWEKQMEKLEETIARLRSGPRDDQVKGHITDVKSHLAALEDLYNAQVAKPRD